MPIENYTSGFLEIYKSIISNMNPMAGNFVNLFFLVLLIVIYSVFVWKFYRFIATKNIIKLNLNQYNKSEHAFFSKIISGAFYFIEYIIILPFLIFFWFSIFTIFLIILTNIPEMKTILIISTIIVAAIRMTSYYKEDLARDLAKLLPFTLLGVAITQPGSFHLETILGHLNKIPTLFGSISNYLIFIIVLEIILRSFELIFSLFGLNDNFPKQENSQTN